MSKNVTLPVKGLRQNHDLLRSLLARVIFTCLLCALSTNCLTAEPTDVAGTAKRLHPHIRWIPASTQKLDFTCRGRSEYAILGAMHAKDVVVNGIVMSRRTPEVVLAVFTEGLAKPPKLLRIEFESPAKAHLTVESLDVTPKEMTEMLGEIPEGWKPSRTCKGLNLSDGETDSIHIYWNHRRGVLNAWRL